MPDEHARKGIALDIRDLDKLFDNLHKLRYEMETVLDDAKYRVRQYRSLLIVEQRRIEEALSEEQEPTKEEEPDA